MPFLREDQAHISVQVGGVNALDAEDTTFTALTNAIKGSWTTLSGGDVAADDVFIRPGGGAPGINLGGPNKRSDATVTILYSTALDAIVGQLEQMTGKRSMAISWTPLDADYNPNGATQTITGVLKQVSRPNFNSNTNAAGFLTLVMACNV